MASGAGTMPYTLGHAWLRPGPSRPEPPHPHLGHHLRGGEGGGGGDGPEPPHPPALRGGRPLFPPLALPPACGGLWAGDGARLLALRGLRQPDPGARPHLGEPERLHHRPERGPRPPPPEACRQGGGPGLPRGLSGLGRGGPPILRPLPAALQRGGPLDLPHRLGLRPLHRPPEVHARAFPSLPLTAVQVLGTALFALPWVLAEGEAWGPVAWGAVLYLGVVATALTTWLQTWGQRHVPAPQAAILYTLEPVWAAFFAYLALGERLSPSGLLGALLVLLATLLAIRRSPA